MALETFTPPRAPSPGTKAKPRLRLREVEFGDGYTQVTRDGLNHIRQTLTLEWEMLTPDDAEEIIAFMEGKGGDTPFLYTPSDENTAIQWRCKEWENTRQKSGFRNVKLTLEQDFTLVE